MRKSIATIQKRGGKNFAQAEGEARRLKKESCNIQTRVNKSTGGCF